MLRRIAILVMPVFILLGRPAEPQQALTAPLQLSSTPKFSVPQVDLAKIEDGINASYYHPDGLTGLDCGATVGWAEVVKELKQTVPEDRLKALDGMSVEVHALRAKPADITVSWLSGTPTNSATLEGATRQMLGGFFQMYWNMFASSLAPSQKDTVRAEVRDDGGYTLHFSSSGTSFTEEIDADLLPSKIMTNAPSTVTEMTLHFSASPNPVTGDLRRLTSVDFSNRIGTSVTNARFDVEYGTVGGFHIPQRLSVNLGGAYSVPVELIGCTVTKQVSVLPPAR